MWTPFIVTGILIVLFIGYVRLCLYEAKQGQRVILPRFRTSLDHIVFSVTNAIERTLRHIVRYTITLSWYYSLHAFLELILKSLAGIYHAVEAVLLSNRDRARALRRERRKNTSHLSKIAEHKEEMKLTPGEAKKRKDKALKGN